MNARLLSVTPVQAGVQETTAFVDSRFRGNDNAGYACGNGILPMVHGLEAHATSALAGETGRC